MTGVAEAGTGIRPGVYDLGEDAYFAATRALSASGAKLLLPPSCPAKYRWAMDNPQPPKDVFDCWRMVITGQEADITCIRDVTEHVAELEAMHGGAP